jgi:hypothetical protein
LIAIQPILDRFLCFTGELVDLISWLDRLVSQSEKPVGGFTKLVVQLGDIIIGPGKLVS